MCSGLNDRVGAEHVQKTRSLPLGYDKTKERARKMASVDGDADRLVYYYCNAKVRHGGAGGGGGGGD